jgi:hypothetical protein
LEINHCFEDRHISRRSLYLILVFLLAIGLGSCIGWHLEYSTPDISDAPCLIQDLLLDISSFPISGWKETGSRSEKAASVRMGIERIGTGFSGPIGGVFQEIYRFKNERDARRLYKDSVKSWFTPAKTRTEWETPQELSNLEVTTDRYQVGCNDLKSGDFEQCQYVAQYGPYIIRFFTGMRSLSYDDFAELVNEIDRRATSCLVE